MRRMGLTGGNGENGEDSGNHLRPRLIGASEATKLGGMGTLYYGDNLEILRRYMKDETVDLVYSGSAVQLGPELQCVFSGEGWDGNEMKRCTLLLAPLLLIL